jgi:carbon-monoxide dehydrogenase medium subunit
MDFAMVGVAVVLWVTEQKLDGRISLGAVAPTPIRAAYAEAQLRIHRELDDKALDAIAQLAAEEIKPISDVRASAEYRKDMTYQLTRRALLQAYQALQAF